MEQGETVTEQSKPNSLRGISSLNVNHHCVPAMYAIVTNHNEMEETSNLPLAKVQDFHELQQKPVLRSDGRKKLSRNYF